MREKNRWTAKAICCSSYHSYVTDRSPPQYVCAERKKILRKNEKETWRWQVRSLNTARKTEFRPQMANSLLQGQTPNEREWEFERGSKLDQDKINDES